MLMPRSTRTSVPKLRLLFLCATVLLIACATRTIHESQRRVTMPSPRGCFVRVWDAASFRAASDYLNGPRDYATPRDLPGGVLWNSRIRSAPTGHAATVTLWTDEGFTGTSLTLNYDAAHQ